MIVAARLAQHLQLHLADHVLVLIDQGEIRRDALPRARVLEALADSLAVRTI